MSELGIEHMYLYYGLLKGQILGFGHDDNSDLSIQLCKVRYGDGCLIHEVINEQNSLSLLREIFPTVFEDCTFETALDASLARKIQLKYHKVNFTTSKNNKVVFPSVLFRPVVFHLQLMLYVNEIRIDGQTNISATLRSYYNDLNVNETIEFSSFEECVNANRPKTYFYLEEVIGNGYVRAQLLDHVYMVYDQYKHTQIPSDVFENVYLAFGFYTPEVANLAFDNFMRMRQWEKSWKLAVGSFLNKELRLSMGFSNEIANILLQN